jgi:hypothetical protein
MDIRKKAKKLYNYLLERHKKGEAYLDNQSIPMAEREKWVDEFMEIGKALGELLGIIGTYTQEEVLEGFKIN